MIDNRRKLVVLITFAAAAVVAALVMVLLSLNGGGTSDVFRLYIGSGTTEESLADGKAKVAEICIQNDTGYTITEGEGSYRVGGELLSEKCIVLTIIGANKAKVEKISKEILAALAQSEIYIEYDKPKSIFVTAE